MFTHLCVLHDTGDYGFDYHFFSDQTLLLVFVKKNVDRVWKIYKLNDATDYWLYNVKETLERENQNKSTDVVKNIMPTSPND